MTVATELTNARDQILTATWDSRSGEIVPQTEDVVLRDGAVELDAVVRYADVFAPTGLVRSVGPSVAGKVVGAYLATMAPLVRATGGDVRSFDGDRVMGVFAGRRKNTQASECALKTNHAVTHFLRPPVAEYLPTIVKAGVRDANDLVLIGDAANIAAKLSEIRRPPWFSYVTEAVYRSMADTSKYSSTGVAMWELLTRSDIVGPGMRLYKTSWRRTP